MKPGINIGTDGFAVPLEIITSTTGIFGLRGSGKTNLAGVLAEGIVRAGQPLCVVDPTGSWWGMKSSRDGKAPGLPVYVFGGEHADVPLEPTAGAVLADFMVEQRVPTILDLSLMRKGEMRRFMIAFAEHLFHKNRQPLPVMIDETAIFAPQSIRGGDVEASRCLGAVEDLATLARRKGIGVVAIAQRPALVNTTLRTQFENLIVLRTIGKHDRVAIDEWVEAKGSKQERDIMMADLAGLPNGTGYFWSPSFLREFRKVSFRLRETFDSSKTPGVGEKIITPKVFAEIDKEKLSAEIAATAEKAKAEDPKELRKQIAERDRRLRELERGSQNVKPVDPEAERQRIQDEADKAVAKAIDAQKRFFDEKVKDFVPSLSCVIGEMAKSHFSMNGFYAPEVRAAKAAASSGVAWHESPSSINSKIERVATTIASGPSASRLSSSGSAGWKRMLSALAQRNGLSARQLGVRAGLSSKSGTFGTYLSKLRKEGYIEGSSDSIRITPEGLKALGPYDPLPAGPDLLRHWKNELGSGSGASRILQALAEAGHPLSHEEVGERAGLSYKSGTYGTYLSKLRTLELITGTREITLSEELT